MTDKAEDQEIEETGPEGLADNASQDPGTEKPGSDPEALENVSADDSEQASEEGAESEDPDVLEVEIEEVGAVQIKSDPDYLKLFVTHGLTGSDLKAVNGHIFRGEDIPSDLEGKLVGAFGEEMYRIHLKTAKLQLSGERDRIISESKAAAKKSQDHQTYVETAFRQSKIPVNQEGLVAWAQKTDTLTEEDRESIASDLDSQDTRRFKRGVDDLIQAYQKANGASEAQIARGIIANKATSSDVSPITQAQYIQAMKNPELTADQETILDARRQAGINQGL